MLHLKDTHNAFWPVTLNVNFCFLKGTFKLVTVLMQSGQSGAGRKLQLYLLDHIGADKMRI